MARPLRIEFPGALYHVTSRGNARSAVAIDRVDRLKFFELLAQGVDRYAWCCHAYCLMDNHYHLIIETAEPNLSRGMRHLNGCYTQAFNRRHGRAGHVFQGRYRAILVQAESYLLELCRYVVLNPVRAGMTHKVELWPWSSYRATAGMVVRPNWLYTEALLSLFSGNKIQRTNAYQHYINAGKGQPLPWQHLRNEVYLGSEEFVENMQSKMANGAKLRGTPKVQYGPVIKPINWYFDRYRSREQAIVIAYKSGHHTQQAIGDYLNLSHTTIGRIIRSHDVQLET
ncbi:MAG: transposase [Proteobacteria bacterium]|nr:transposase [Pseudomonadota bacterium]